MKIIKIVIMFLLIVVSAVFGFIQYSQNRPSKKDAPVITCPQKVLELSVKDDKDVLMKSVSASDNQDGDLTDKIRISGISKLISNNTAKVSYIVFDSDNNMASCTRMIKYTDYQRPRFAINQPLVFVSDDSISLLDKISASDVIDGDITSSIRISTLTPTDNNYMHTVTVQVTNSMGDTARLGVPIIIRATDPLAPVITLKENLVYLNSGAAFDPVSYIASVTAPDAELSASDVTVSGTVNTAEVGTYYVSYSCSQSGHTTLTVLTVVVQ